MTEIEQLKADLETIQNAAKIAKRQGFHERTGNYDMVEGELKEKIANLEAQQSTADEWAEIKEYIDESPDDGTSWPIVTANWPTAKKYIRHLQAKVAELDKELRCERIDGGKVRADRKAISAEQNRQELAKLTTILNAIPPACGLARELVEKRIEGVKKEMQGNG